MVRSPSNVALEVEVWESLVVELLLTIAVHQHPFNWDSLAAGKAGFQAIRKGMSPELEKLLNELDFTHHRVEVWNGLVGFSWQRRLVDPRAAAGTIETASDADVAAWQACIPESERRRPGELRRQLARVVRLWHRDLVAAREAEVSARLRAEADRLRGLAATESPEALVEVATNGIAWRPVPGVGRVVLVPSEVMSPWSSHERVGDTMLFSCPLPDAGGDEGERILRLSWVLADRSRVAAMRLLAERTMTLQELADELGLRKSTMHHHLALLRAAGLLRVAFGTKSYSLRREPLEELSGALSLFGRAK